MPPNQDLEGGFLYLGAPARLARELADQEKRSLKYFSGSLGRA